MKRFLKPYQLPLIALGSGILGALLRLWLYKGGVDEKGLLISGHPSQILIWILTAAVLAVLILYALGLKGAPKYSFNFPVSPAGAVGCLLAAAGAAWYGLSGLISGGFSLAALLAFPAACAMGLLGDLRRKGLRPSPALHCIFCLFLAADLLAQYRVWCADPQISDYCFALLGLVCALLSGFQSACFAGGMGRRDLHALFHLAGIFFCLMCLPHGGRPWLYLSLAAWMYTDLCSLRPLARKKRR